HTRFSRDWSSDVCSSDLSVTVRDLALMAATLANGGVQPNSGERVLDSRLVRHVLSVMMSSGMYDAAGDWLTTVGIPSKSGVAGEIGRASRRGGALDVAGG